MDWCGREVPVDEDGLPRPLRFRPTFDWKASLLGVLGDIGRQVLLQQLGDAPLSETAWIETVIVGVVAGVFFPSLGRLIGVVLVNRAVRKARRTMHKEAA